MSISLWGVQIVVPQVVALMIRVMTLSNSDVLCEDRYHAMLEQNKFKQCLLSFDDNNVLKVQ